jgi:hypothetical protein
MVLVFLSCEFVKVHSLAMYIGQQMKDIEGDRENS